MEDRVKLTADDSDYQNVMRRAGATADQFGGRIQQASSKFESLFKRTPGRRAELALSHLTQSLTSGDLVGGLTSFAGKISGLGLGIGVAVGAGVEVFSVLHKSIVEVREAHEKLDEQMRKPLDLVNIEKFSAAIDDLKAKEQSVPHGIVNIFKDLTFGGKAFGRAAGETSLKEVQELKDASIRLQEAQQVSGQRDLFQATKLSLIGNDPEARGQAESRFKFDERRRKEKEQIDKGTQDRLDAIDVEQEAFERSVDRKKALRAEEFQDAKKLLEIQGLATLRSGAGASPDQIKNLSLLERYKATQRGLARTDLSPEERNSLTLKSLQEKNELAALHQKPDLRPDYEKAGFHYGTGASREFESQYSYSGFARRHIEDALSQGGLAAGALRSDQFKTAEQALIGTGSATADEIAGYKKNIGALPGSDGQSQAADVVKAVQELTKIVEKVWAE